MRGPWRSSHFLITRGRRRRRRRRLPRRAHPQPRGDRRARTDYHERPRHRSARPARARRSTTRPATRSACLGIENRELRPRPGAPSVIQNAVIATEDKTFWDNDGVDLGAVARGRPRRTSRRARSSRAARRSPAAREEPDPPPKRDLNRKIREIVLAFRLNKELLEARDPRAVPQHRLLRAELLRHQGGGRALLRHARPGVAVRPAATQHERAHDRRGRAARRARSRARRAYNPFTAPRGARSAAQRSCSSRWSTRATSPRSRRPARPTSRCRSNLKPDRRSCARATTWVEEIQDRLVNDPRYRCSAPRPKERQDRVLKGGLKIYTTLDPAMQTHARRTRSTQIAAGEAGLHWRRSSRSTRRPAR